MKDKKQIIKEHRVISPKLLLSDNDKDLRMLLIMVAKKYRVSIEAAKNSLAKAYEIMIT